MTCIYSNLAATLGTPTEAGTLLGNYAQILGALHAAAPQAEIVMFNIYNPLAVVPGLSGSDLLLTQYVNPAIAQLAASFSARVADTFDAINHNPSSALTSETASVCALTWMCSSYVNIHPTDLGYEAMDGALQDALYCGHGRAQTFLATVVSDSAALGVCGRSAGRSANR